MKEFLIKSKGGDKVATNICSRSRRNFVKPKVIQEQYQISKTQVYKILKMPEFEECIKKVGEGCIRIDQDKFYEISEQVFY